MYKHLLLILLFSVLGVFLRIVPTYEMIVGIFILGMVIKLYFKWSFAYCLTIICIGLSIAWFSLGFFYHTNILVAYDEFHTYKGIVKEFESESNQGTIEIISVDGHRILPKKVLVKLLDSTIHIGQKIELEAIIKKIDSPTNPGEANFRYIYYGKNIIGKIETIAKINMEEKESVSNLLHLKEQLISRLTRDMRNDQLGLSLAMSIGDKSYLLEEDEVGLRKLGLSHILVVSSLHVGLLVVILSGQLNLLKVSFIKKELILVGFLLMLLFITTSKISVLKCIFIYITHLIAQLNNRKPFYLFSLALYTLLALVMNPFYFYNLSFTLSLMAYIGVFVYYRYSSSHCHKWLRPWYLVLCIYIAITPIFLMTFGGFHYLGLIISPFLMPYLEALIGINFLNVMVQSFVDLSFFTHIVNYALEPLKMLVNISNRLSDHYLMIPYASGILLILSFILSLMCLHKTKKPYQHKLFKCLAVFGVIILIFTVIEHHGPMRVYYLDVGMGDSQYIYQGNTSVLIDGGKSFSTYHLKNIMKKTGEKTVDIGIISHEHNDHFGGMIELLEENSIRKLYMTEYAYLALKDNYSVIERYKEKNQINIVKEPVKISAFSDWQLTLFPPMIKSDELNNHSMLTLLQRGKLDFLFTGDAEKEEEQWMTSFIPGYITPPLDYLKVPHHGSITSSCESFLLAVKPNYGMISVGENNHYGLPDKEILDRYQSIGTEIFRTDQQGGLEIKVIYPWVFHKDYLGEKHVIQ